MAEGRPSPLGELCALIRDGATRAAIETHLTNNPDVDILSRVEDATVSHWASLLGQLETLKCFAELGSAGTFVIAAESTGMQPMHWACTSGQLRVAQWLVEECGVDINAKDIKGTTPLMIAVQYHHTSLVEYLLGAGADASLLDNDGDSALHWAAYKDSAMSVKPLMYRPPPAQRVAPNMQDAYGSTPLHLAAAQGSCKALALLLHHGDGPGALGMADRKGRTPMQVASERGQHATRRMLEAQAAGKLVDPDDFALSLPPVDLWWRDALERASSTVALLSERIGLSARGTGPGGDGAAGAAPAAAHPAAEEGQEMTEMSSSSKDKEEESRAQQGKKKMAVLEMKPVVEDGGELI